MSRQFTGTGRVTRAGFTWPTVYSVCYWLQNPTVGGSEPYTFYSVNEAGSYFVTATSWRIDLNYIANCGVWGADPGVTLAGWHHFAVVHDASAQANTPVMYVDGVPKTVVQHNVPAATFAGSSQTLAIGNSDTGSLPIGGSMAAFSVHNVLLSAAEVREAMWRGFTPRGRMITDLLDGESPTKDLSGNGRDGTVTGTTVVPGPSIPRSLVSFPSRPARPAAAALDLEPASSYADPPGVEVTDPESLAIAPASSYADPVGLDVDAATFPVYALPAQVIELTAEGFASGLVGTVGLRIETEDGTVVEARTTAGIIAEPGAPGAYTATLTSPGALGVYRVVWDDAALTTAGEYLMVVAVLPVDHPYQVTPGHAATLGIDGFNPGLVGTVGLRINDGQGATVLARFTAGITEIPGSPGSYEATFSAPGSVGSFVAIWDDGAGSTGAETFLVVFAPAPPPPPGPPRSPAGPLPWMVYGGVEIGNAARTLSYLTNRHDVVSNPQGILGISRGWQVGQAACCSCPVLATDGAGNPVDFTRPDDLGVSLGDPAPWYDPGVPESAEFLGVLITEITGLDSTVGRSKTERAAGLGGAALGSQRAGGREIGVRAVLIATSCPGLDYGRRWLSHALANDLCDDCETYQLELRTTCPPEDRPDVGLANLYEVGLSEGPKVVRGSDLPNCCDLLEVEWTLTAGNPLMYACPVSVVPETLIADVGGIVSATIDPPEPFGTIAAQIEVQTGIGFGFGGGFGGPVNPGVGVLVRAWDQLLTDPCPGADGEECLSIRLAGLPGGVTVTIDGARQRLILTDVAGVESDGLPYVVMSDGQAFSWPEFVGCQRVCVAVSVYVDPGGGTPTGASVAISSQHRFLA